LDFPRFGLARAEAFNCLWFGITGVMAENPFVSIILPTRNRVPRLNTCIMLLEKNTIGHNYEVVVVFDPDDAETEGWVTAAAKRNPRIVPVKNPERRQLVWSANHGVRRSSGQILASFMDDVEVEPHWLDEALKCFRKRFPDGQGFVSLNDGRFGPRFAVVAIVSRSLLQRIYGGDLFYSGYVHFGGDHEVSDLARALGRFVYCPKSIAFHNHPDWATKPALWDGTYAEAHPLANKDNSLYKQRIRWLFWALHLKRTPADWFYWFRGKFIDLVELIQRMQKLQSNG